MFSFLSRVSLSEYIRRRRLTLAALDLKNKDMRVIDVAVKYGYRSADSFSRAFHFMHEILPSEVRSEHTQLKAYPRMTFQLSIKGGCEAAPGPEILWNESSDTKNPKYRSEIWIPVRKRIVD